MYAASLFASLYIFWILLSGFFTPFLLISGVGCTLAVVWLAHRMEVADPEGHPMHLWATMVFYWPWLILEIVKSAWTVSKIIISPTLPISPTMVRFKPKQKTTVGLVIHANSITLTPGTIAIEVAADEFLVHGLTAEGAAGVIDSEMDARVAKCEGNN